MNLISCEQLVSLGRQVPTPFRLTVQEGQDEDEIVIESILRIVPGKRLVGLSRWNDQQVIVKLFYNPSHWKRNQLRDLKGCNLLKQAQLPTPDIVHHTATPDQKGGVLMIEYLQEGTTLGTLFEDASSAEHKSATVRKGLETIARCHGAGLLQKDIHLDNFMLANGTVYLLDGGDISSYAGDFDTDTRLNNLATFFAQFPVGMDAEAPELLVAYQEQTSEMTESQLAGFIGRISTARKLRMGNFERKLFRSTTANRCVWHASKFLVHDRSIHSPELDAFIANPDVLLDRGEVLKRGNSSTVVRVKIGGQEFVLKHYNIKSFWHGLSRLFRPSRAHHSWRNANLLKMLGVATPQPYLFMEERICWLFRRRAYFLCELVAGDNLIEELETNNFDLLESRSVVDAFRDLLKTLRTYRIHHGDMKASNFIFSNERLYVLDLDAMQRHKTERSFRKKYAKDLARFSRNWKGSKLEKAVDRMIENL